MCSLKVLFSEFSPQSAALKCPTIHEAKTPETYISVGLSHRVLCRKINIQYFKMYLGKNSCALRFQQHFLNMAPPKKSRTPSAHSYVSSSTDSLHSIDCRWHSHSESFIWEGDILQWIPAITNTVCSWFPAGVVMGRNSECYCCHMSQQSYWFNWLS